MHTIQETPLVSVVMATYNGGKFLKDQLNSILQQTYSPIEIVISDDGSTDDTIAIIKDFQGIFPSTRLIQQEQNLGYIKNFEQAMLHARGEYIALSDQDDIWLPQKIETLLAQLGDNKIVYSDSALIDEAGRDMHKRMSEVRNTIDYNNSLMCLVGSWSPGHAMLFKRDLLKECIPFPAIVSHDFWLGFIAAGTGTVHYVDEALVQYRQHASNAIGAINGAQRKKAKKNKQDSLALARERMELLYIHCPENPASIKDAFRQFYKSYRSFSLYNNTLRVYLFLKYRHLVLAYKKKTELMKIFYCLKMFFKLV